MLGLLFEHPGRDFAVMIQGGLLKQIKQPAGGPALGITATENDPANPAMQDRARAHRARFLGYIEIAVAQTPITEGSLGLGESQHLGMGSGILERLHLVVGPGNDASLLHDDRPHRNLLAEVGLLRLAERLTHHEGVALQIDERFLVKGV